MTKLQGQAHLYPFYCVDILAALQTITEQMNTFIIQRTNKNCVYVSFFNHSITNTEFYGVIQKDNYKSSWKLCRFLNKKQIQNSYGVNIHKLPSSPKEMSDFIHELQHAIIFNGKDFVYNVNWSQIQQIKFGKKYSSKTIIITEQEWIKECQKSFENPGLSLFPVIVTAKQHHKLEWIQLIHIECKNMYTALSCQYEAKHNQWHPTAIILDIAALKAEDRFIGPVYNNNEYNKKGFYKLLSPLTQIIFAKNENNDIMDGELEILGELIYKTHVISEIPNDGSYPGAAAALSLAAVHSSHQSVVSHLRVNNQLYKQFIECVANIDENDEKHPSLQVVVKTARNILATNHQKSNTRIKLKKKYLNISISKELTTKIIPQRIKEKFSDLFHYMQEFIMVYKFDVIVECDKIRVINYNFHCAVNAESLYVVCEKRYDENSNKMYWRTINHLFTANEIEGKYKMKSNELPQALILPPKFEKQLNHKEQIIKILKDVKQRECIISSTKWENPQKVPINGRKKASIISMIQIKESEFIKTVNFSADKAEHIHLIPIIRCNEDGCTLEHAWVVTLETRLGSFDVAISLTLNTNNNSVKASSIYLDITDACRLVPEKYRCNVYDLLSFKSMDNLEIGNATKVVMHQLKQQNESLKQKLKKEKLKLNPMDVRVQEYIKLKADTKENDSDRDIESELEAMNDQHILCTVLNVNAPVFSPCGTRSVSTTPLSTIPEENANYIYKRALLLVYGYVRKHVILVSEIGSICIKYYDKNDI